MRTLLIAVAIVAAALYAQRLWRMSCLYRRGAELAARNQSGAEFRIAFLQSHPGSGPGRVEQYRELATYYAAVKRSYERAIWQPWLRLSAPPPPPSE